jgi:hypothetical protein
MSPIPALLGPREGTRSLIEEWLSRDFAARSVKVIGLSAKSPRDTVSQRRPTGNMGRT